MNTVATLWRDTEYVQLTTHNDKGGQGIRRGARPDTHGGRCDRHL